MLLLHERDPADLAALAGPAGLALARARAVLLPLSNARDADLSRPRSGTHWTLLAWARGRGFAHFDSSAAAGGSADGADAAGALAAVLVPLVDDGSDAGGHTAAVVNVRCPAQTNGRDCGVHVAWAMERLALALARQADAHSGETSAAAWWEAALGPAPEPLQAGIDDYRAHMLAVVLTHAVTMPTT